MGEPDAVTGLPTVLAARRETLAAVARGGVFSTRRFLDHRLTIRLCFLSEN